MEQLLPLLSEVGFPAVVTFYVLHRLETKLELVNKSIQSLPERMAKAKN